MSREIKEYTRIVFTGLYDVSGKVCLMCQILSFGEVKP